MMSFEMLVMAHINTIIPETLDPLKFTYRNNKSKCILYLRFFKVAPFALMRA
jgi:hypothetical protein